MCYGLVMITTKFFIVEEADIYKKFIENNYDIKR